MIRHLLLLPDGREIFSGSNDAAIREVKLTRAVNEGTELTPGAVSAAILEADVFTSQSLGLEAGEEVTLFQVDRAGQRQQLGIFRLAKPTRLSQGVRRLTGCDRVSLLDQDLSLWLASLNGWPYRLWDFLAMVFDHCGLEWADSQIPGGDIPVAAFSAAGITGRQLISWGAQLAGRFCRVRADGLAEFAWYTPASVTVGPTGDCFYYQGSLTYGDYQVEKIRKVQLQQTAQDVGAVYPDTDEAVNTLRLTGNLLLSGCSVTQRQAIAQRLYEQLKDMTYTPASLAVSGEFGVTPGQILQILTPDGKRLTAYVMESVRTGGREELRCTGEASRTASAAFNQQSYKALSGRVLELQLDMDGIKAENRDAAGNLAALALNLEGISGKVAQQEAAQTGLKTELSQLQLTAGALNLRLQSVEETGVTQVTTQTGYTFDQNGLHIARDRHPVASRLDHTGLYVNRYGQPVLQANDAGVVAYDVTVGNYLVVGNYSRFEDYVGSLDAKRTGCFFVG